MSSRPQEGALPMPIMSGKPRPEPRAQPEARSWQDPDDEELSVRLQAADRGALDVLFSRDSRLVFSIALRILRDRGEAEDVVQETFFHVFVRAGLFDPKKGSLRAWIVQMAFHRALDRKSYLARRNFYAGTTIDSLDDTLSGATDLDREVGAELNRAQLERAFAELPETQRRTLEMFYFDELELREIAGRLNESLGNVRHHYYRALERLRKSALVARLRGVKPR